MKAYLLAAVASMALIAPAAFADDGLTTVTTTVNTVCKITHSPNSIAIQTKVYNGGTTIGQIKTGGSTGSHTVGVFCNNPGSSLSISRDELVNSSYTPSQAALDQGFTNKIDFEAVLTGARELDTTGAEWATAGGSDGTRPAIYPFGVYQTDLDLKIDKVLDLNVGTKPVDGSYAGKVTVIITPGV